MNFVQSVVSACFSVPSLYHLKENAVNGSFLTEVPSCRLRAGPGRAILFSLECADLGESRKGEIDKMSVMEKLFTRRTYRRFRQKAVPQDVVEDLIEAVRISSSAANRQPVRLVIVNTPEAAGQMGGLSAAGAGRPEGRRTADAVCRRGG